MRDDGFGQRRTKAGNPRQQRRRRGIEIDADGIHRVFDHGLQRAAKTELIDIVLVLANADRFRLDLHQLGERILQTARDGDGPAQRHVEPGEFLGRRLGRGIDRGAGLADDDLERLRCGHIGQHLGHQLFRLAAAGAITDGDQFDAVLAHQARQFGLRAAHVVLRREWIDRRRRQHLAGAIDHGDLYAGADARVEPHGGARSGGCGEQ